MRKIWNTILPALLIVLGTYLAPEHVAVSEPITYVWIILLQVPVMIVAALLTIGISMFFAHSAFFGSKTGLALLIVVLLLMGIIIGMIAFRLMDQILAGLTINGFWTYAVLSILYGMLSLDVQKEKQ